MTKINSKLNVEMKKATLDDKQPLENLFQLYLHDLSAYTDNLHVDSEGRFDSSDVSLFFSEDHLIPLKVVMDGQWVGFVFLIKGKTVDYVINDLFILKKFRNRGLGKVVVEDLFAHYKGTYAVMQLVTNKPAIAFWHSFYEANQIDYEESEMISDGEQCLLQKFPI